VAHQKSHAKVFFQLPDLHAKRGLRNMELFGRPRHVAGLNNGYKILQLAQIH
jgi:hypothetical protein